METPGVGMGVRYENVDAGYLDQRKLKKSAGWILLWALGVGAVISGDFGGWNLGLAAGGFGGLAIATALMTVMYVCMVYSIAELSAALPHAGGFYSFARNAFGPWGGMIVGISDTIEYVITPATIVFFIGGYMQTLLPSVPLPVWWAGFYAVFLALNILGVELTFKVGLAVTALAMLVLAAFYVAAIGSGAFKPTLLFNIPPDPGQTSFLPKGIFGIFAAIPFAIWFYLAIEQLPLAAEETKDVVTNMPKALIYGILTLIVLTVGTLILNTGIGGGAVAMGASPGAAFGRLQGDLRRVDHHGSLHPDRAPRADCELSHGDLCGRARALRAFAFRLLSTLDFRDWKIDAYAASSASCLRSGGILHCLALPVVRGDRGRGAS